VSEGQSVGSGSIDTRTEMLALAHASGSSPPVRPLLRISQDREHLTRPKKLSAYAVKPDISRADSLTGGPRGVTISSCLFCRGQNAGVAQWLEQLFCKQQVGSSNLSTGWSKSLSAKFFEKFARVAERLMAADCKSAEVTLRRFESAPLHHTFAMLKCRKCDEPFLSYIKVEGRVHNISKRKYCLECSPFGLHNTRKVEVERATGCVVCGGRDSLKGNLCGVCTTKIARWRLKLAMVKAKGGKCERCGWSGNPVAFDFHHLDPSVKEVKLNMSTQSSAVMLKELEKCILLCTRCHRLEHVSEVRSAFWKQVFDYSGGLEIGEIEEWEFLLD